MADSVSGDQDKLVASAWQDQALWSAVANELGNSIRRWRVAAAIAAVAGLFITVLAGTLSNPDWQDRRGQLITVGVLLLALVPYVRQKMLSPERQQAWVRARNVSELLKEAIYRHLMGATAAPADAATNAATDATTNATTPPAPGALTRRCREIKQAAADLARLAAAVSPAQRERKLRLSLADYLEERVEGQIRYYKKNGEQAGKTARRLHAAEFGLGLAAVGLGALSGQNLPTGLGEQVAGQTVVISMLVPWLTLVAAAASAITAHIAAARHDELASRYFATYDLIKSQRDEWLLRPDHDTPAQVQIFVDEVERTLSSENGAWVTDWNKSNSS